MTEPRSSVREGDRLIYGGLLGLSVAGSLQLFDKNPGESSPLTVAVYAFALSLPILSASLVAEMVRHNQPRPGPVAVWRQFLGLAGALGAITGLAALFFHVGPVPGSLFLASSTVAALLVRRL